MLYTELFPLVLVNIVSISYYCCWCCVRNNSCRINRSNINSTVLYIDSPIYSFNLGYLLCLYFLICKRAVTLQLPFLTLDKANCWDQIEMLMEVLVICKDWNRWQILFILLPSMGSGWQPPAWGFWRPELGPAMRQLWPMTIKLVSQGVLKPENQCLGNLCQKGWVKAFGWKSQICRQG